MTLPDQLTEDLEYLQSAGALDGIREIVSERRRQLETGHTPAGDVEHFSATTLGIMAVGQLTDHVWPRPAKAGALCARTLDRLRSKR